MMYKNNSIFKLIAILFAFIAQINPIFSVDLKNKYHDIKRKDPEIEVIFSNLEELERNGEKHPLHHTKDRSDSYADFFLHGFPVNTPILFKVFRPAVQATNDKDCFFEDRFIFNGNGQLISVEGYHLAGGISVGSRGFLLGEKISVVFETTDRKIKKEFSYTPVPIEAHTLDGRITVKGELLRAFPATYTITASGLEDGEEYDFQSRSAHELNEGRAQKNSMHYLMPAVLGLKKGTCFVKMTFENNQEVRLALPWARSLEDYIELKNGKNTGSVCF